MNNLAHKVVVAMAGLLFLSDSGAVAMRADFYDTTDESRYESLAAQDRFSAVGGIVLSAALDSTQIGSEGLVCSATLIDPNTVLTAAHCFLHDVRPPGGIGPLPQNFWEITPLQLGVVYVVFRPNQAGQVIARATDYVIHPAWLSNHNGRDAEDHDLAVLQVYDIATNGPVTTIPPVPLYEGDDEGTNTNFPVIVGYGTTVYGADVPDPNGPRGGVEQDNGGIKRGALAALFVVEPDGQALMTQFLSPGWLTHDGFPANFLEGNISEGDSGGGFFLPDSSTGVLEVAGVASAALPPDDSPPDDTWYWRYRQYPDAGGARGFYTRVSQNSEWIHQNSFGAATPYPPIKIDYDPALLVAATDKGAAEFNTPVAATCGSYSLNLRYAFLDSVGSADIYLGGTLVGSVVANGDGLQDVTIPVSVNSCTTLTDRGFALAALVKTLTFRMSAPASTRFLLDQIAFPGLANGDFMQGTSGWGFAGGTTGQIVDVTTVVGGDAIFSNGFEQ
jgi:hypothetical protein